MTSTIIDRTFTIPDTIPTDTDATDALLDFVAGVPDGYGPLDSGDTYVNGDPQGKVAWRVKNRIVIPKNYLIDGTFRPIGRKDLVFDFPGGSFTRRVSQPGAQVCLTHCSHVEVLNPTIVGAKPYGATYSAAHESEHAFQFESSHHCDVRFATTSHIWGDHYWFGKHSGDPMWSDNCHVYDSQGTDSGRDPIAMTSANACGVHRCTFGPGRTCIDLEPNGASGGVSNVLVEDCTFNGPYLGNFLAALGNNNLEGTVDNVTVRNNKTFGVALQARVGGGRRRSYFTVVNNYADRLPGSTTSIAIGNGRRCLMEFNGVQGPVVVTDNHSPVQQGRHMLVARFPNCPGPITYERNWKDDDVIPDYTQTGGTT